MGNADNLRRSLTGDFPSVFKQVWPLFAQALGSGADLISMPRGVGDGLDGQRQERLKSFGDLVKGSRQGLYP